MIGNFPVGSSRSFKCTLHSVEMIIKHGEDGVPVELGVWDGSPGVLFCCCCCLLTWYKPESSGKRNVNWENVSIIGCRQAYGHFFFFISSRNWHERAQPNVGGAIPGHGPGLYKKKASCASHEMYASNRCLFMVYVSAILPCLSACLGFPPWSIDQGDMQTK